MRSLATALPPLSSPPVFVAGPAQVLRRVERLDASTVSLDRRRWLTQEMYALYRQRHPSPSREKFEEEQLAGDSVRVALFRDERKEIVGYAVAAFSRASRRGEVVLTTSECFRPGYARAYYAARFCAAEAIRFKLRHPFTRLALLTPIIDPATYGRCAETFRAIFPNRRRDTPAPVEQTASAIVYGRNMPVTGYRPWALAEPQSQTVPEPKRGAPVQSLDARFFTRRVDGTGAKALLVWIPCSLPNVIAAAIRFVLGW